jgi:hypothetical protein
MALRLAPTRRHRATPQIVISDTHRGNLILMDYGLLAPIDLRVQPLSGSLLETVTQLCSPHCAHQAWHQNFLGLANKRFAKMLGDWHFSEMSTLAEIESAAAALPASEKAELLLFLAGQLRAERAPLPEPRLFTPEQIHAWMDEDEEDMRKFRAGE